MLRSSRKCICNYVYDRRTMHNEGGQPSRMKSLEERLVDTKLERKRLTGITHAQNAKTRPENLTNQADGNRCETFVGMTRPCKRVQAILFAFDNVTTLYRFPRYTCLFFFFPCSIYISFLSIFFTQPPKNRSPKR